VEHDDAFVRTTGDDNDGGDERFRRESRLRSSLDFARVRRRGKRQQGRWLMLAYLRRVDAPDAANLPSRFGLSVSKRVGSAVQRNRVKRRLREAIRRRLWKTLPGWDMILTARPEAADVEYAALADEIQNLLTRARLLR
jgi:ribonuclease P protein component